MMERKFTDAEIVKALEICSKNNVTRHNELTYEGMPLRFLFEDALDLINRKNAEIEELTKLLRSRHRAIEHLEGVIVSLPDQVRAEAIKEFAERLKEKLQLNRMVFGYNGAFVGAVQLDNLVKEMTGENNGN